MRKPKMLNYDCDAIYKTYLEYKKLSPEEIAVCIIRDAFEEVGGLKQKDLDKVLPKLLNHS